MLAPGNIAYPLQDDLQISCLTEATNETGSGSITLERSDYDYLEGFLRSNNHKKRKAAHLFRAVQALRFERAPDRRNARWILAGVAECAGSAVGPSPGAQTKAFFYIGRKATLSELAGRLLLAGCAA